VSALGDMAILRCRVWRLLHLYYAMFLTLYVFHVYAFINFECTQLIRAFRIPVPSTLEQARVAIDNQKKIRDCGHIAWH